MSHDEFAHILSSINTLSPDQMRQLYRELESRMAATAANGDDATEQTAYDVARRAGVIGCITGAPRSPTTLGIDPKQSQY